MLDIIKRNLDKFLLKNGYNKDYWIIEIIVNNIIRIRKKKQLKKSNKYNIFYLYINMFMLIIYLFLKLSIL